MSLEKICVSLETAKKLHEAEIKIESIFYWVKNRSDKVTIYTEYYLTDSWDDYQHCEIYPAPTAEEIELPDYVEVGDSDDFHEKLYFLNITLGVNHWRINYINRWNNKALIDYDELEDVFEFEHKLCEVMCYVKIWLKEQGYLK